MIEIVPVRKERIVFLDRDGTINVRSNVEGDPKYYIKEWKDFEFLPGAKEAIRKLLKRRYFVGVVSNQGGISKGITRFLDVEAVFWNMVNDICDNPIEYTNDAFLSATIVSTFCPHSEEDGCQCRKPKPGLIDWLCIEHSLSIEKAWMIGDSYNDCLAGYHAGMRGQQILVNSLEDAAAPKYKFGDALMAKANSRHVVSLRVPTLQDAVDFILRYEGV